MPKYQYILLMLLHFIYYITFNYKLWETLLNIKLTISISGPISKITIGPGPIVLFFIGPAFLRFDWLTFRVGLYAIIIPQPQNGGLYWIRFVPSFGRSVRPSPICVRSITPLPMEGFPSNLNDTFTSTRGCAEPMLHQGQGHS